MTPEQKKLYRLKADLVSAAADPIRLAVIDFLAGGEQCVCDIAKFVGAERSNVSRHLAVMLRAGLVDSRKDGLKVMYSLRTPCIMKFISCVTDVIRHQARESSRILEKI